MHAHWLLLCPFLSLARRHCTVAQYICWMCAHWLLLRPFLGLARRHCTVAQYVRCVRTGCCSARSRFLLADIALLLSMLDVCTLAAAPPVLESCPPTLYCCSVCWICAHWLLLRPILISARRHCTVAQYDECVHTGCCSARS